MSEWLKEHAWKACVGETLPWVRIPLSPPTSLTPANTVSFGWQADRPPSSSERLALLEKHGPTPLAFTFKQRFTVEEMLAHSEDTTV